MREGGGGMGGRGGGEEEWGRMGERRICRGREGE